MSHDWYLREDGETFGPYPKSQLISLAKSGRLSPSTRVRNGDDGEWQRAADVPGLFRPADAPLGSKPPARGKATASQEPAIPTRLMLIVGGAAAGLLTTGAVVAWLVMSAFSLKEPAVATTPDDAAPVAATPGEAETTAETDAVVVAEPAPTLPTTEPPAKEPAADVASTSGSESGEKSEDNPQKQEPILPLLADDEDEISEPPQAVAVETLTRTDAQVTEFIKRVKLNREATDAYAQFKSYSTRYEFTEAQRVRLDLELAEWKKRADSNLCRLGSEWVPERELVAAEQESQQLIKAAAEQLEELEFSECIKLLKDASRVNPNGVRADYTLGLLYSLPFAGVKAPKTAERHFRNVLQRRPDHPAALNSLAIAQIKQREYSAAIGSLGRAAALNQNDQEVIQNLGRFIMLAESERLPAPPDSVIRRCRNLYKELTSTDGAKEFDPRTGWLHMLPVFPDEGPTSDRPQQKPDRPAKSSDKVPMFGGTGFVVAPGYVLTNRHVVDDSNHGLGVADEVRTLDPADSGRKRELLGEVLVVSSEMDLALVRFEGLSSAVVELENSGVDLASDVLIMGFPQTHILGSGLKTTRGIVSALPDPSRAVVPEYVLFDAAADHGNSGGPVINRRGRAVAVLTVVVKTASGLSGGVTADSAIAFVKQHVPTYQAPADAIEAEQLDWADVTRRLSPSVLQLTCYYDAGIPELSIAANRAHHSGNAYEDRTCPWCNGLGRVACPQRGCISGRISVPYYVDEIVGSGMNRQVITHKKFRREPCSMCDGHGAVDCIGCSNGFDRELR